MCSRCLDGNRACLLAAFLAFDQAENFGFNLSGSREETVDSTPETQSARARHPKSPRSFASSDKFFVWDCQVLAKLCTDDNRSQRTTISKIQTLCFVLTEKCPGNLRKKAHLFTFQQRYGVLQRRELVFDVISTTALQLIMVLSSVIVQRRRTFRIGFVLKIELFSTPFLSLLRSFHKTDAIP